MFLLVLYVLRLVFVMLRIFWIIFKFKEIFLFCRIGVGFFRFEFCIDFLLVCIIDLVNIIYDLFIKNFRVVNRGECKFLILFLLWIKGCFDKSR